MNRNWLGTVSKILGTFWERNFKDQDVLVWVKTVLSNVIERTSYIGQSRDTVKTILKDKENLFYVSPIQVPVSEGFKKASIVGRMGPMNTGLVQQSSPDLCVVIPMNTTGLLHIQSSISSPSCVWLDGFNMTVYSDKVVLYVRSYDEIPTTVKTVDGEVVEYYQMYGAYKRQGAGYDDDFGVITGLDFDAVSDDIRKVLWSTYINGMSPYDYRYLLAKAAGNDICDEDSVVSSVFSEHGKWYVTTTAEKMYSGYGESIVSSGDSVSRGDFLFSGAETYDGDALPPANKVPSLPVMSEGESVTAVNSFLPPIKTPVGYVPAFQGRTWLQRVVSFQTAYPGVLPALRYPYPVNPLWYLLEVLRGRCSTIGVITAPEADSVILSQLKSVVRTSSCTGGYVESMVTKDVGTEIPMYDYISVHPGEPDEDVTCFVVTSVDIEDGELCLSDNKTTAAIRFL